MLPHPPTISARLPKKSGIHRQAFRVHAEADRLRYPRRGHDNGAAAQQSKAPGEAHHRCGDRDVRRLGTKEHAQLGVAVPGLSLRSLHLEQEGDSRHSGIDL